LTSTTQVDALYPGEQAGQPMFSLADGSVVQDMSISDSPANFNEDGATIGFCQALVPTGVKATLRRLYLDCNDWTVYNYVSQATFVIEDCEIHSGRFCIAMANSGLGQTCIVRGCQLVVDAMKSKSVGESSNQTYGHATGIVHMGGLLQVYETSFNVLGSPNADGHTAVDAGSNPISWAPYTTGITDTYNHGPATATAWEIRSCSFAVNPNGVTLANHTGDLRMTGPNTNSTLKLFWCDGDGSSNVTSKLLV